jgi:hypothetical protein
MKTALTIYFLLQLPFGILLGKFLRGKRRERPRFN